MKNEIMFGSIIQNKNESKIKEPIQWIICSQQDSFIRLISKHILFPYWYENVPWHESELRQYLNNDFISLVFSVNEQTLLQESHKYIYDLDYKRFIDDRRNRDYLNLPQTESHTVDYYYSSGYMIDDLITLPFFHEIVDFNTINNKYIELRPEFKGSKITNYAKSGGPYVEKLTGLQRHLFLSHSCANIWTVTNKIYEPKEKTYHQIICLDKTIDKYNDYRFGQYAIGIRPVITLKYEDCLMLQ